MIELQLGFGVVDVSHDVYQQYLDEGKSKEINGDIAAREIVNRTVLGVINYMERIGYERPSNVRCLDAHGTSSLGFNTNSGEAYYDYFDIKADSHLSGRNYNPINEWIREHDGKYDVLIIFPCNDGHVFIEPRKSFLIYPLGLSCPDRFADEKVEQDFMVFMPPRDSNRTETYPNKFRKTKKDRIFDFISDNNVE